MAGINPTSSQKQLNYRSYFNEVRGLYDKPIARTSTALILTIITITFFGFAAIRPSLGTVSQLVKELEEKREIDEKITKKIAALSAAQDEYLASTNLLKNFEIAIPPQQQLQETLLKLEFIVFQSTTTLSSIRLGPLTTFGQISPQTVTGDAFPSYQIGLAAEGRYQQLQTLLERINNLDRFIRIEQVTFAQAQNLDDPDPDQISMNVNLRLFWSPPNTNQESDITTEN